MTPPASPIPLKIDLAAELDFWSRESQLFNAEHDLFTMTSRAGHPRLAVVTGPNASGKSLLVRAFAERVRATGMLPLTISVRERTGSSGDGMAGMRKVFMYGDDGTQSTGAGSINVVRAALERNLDRPEGSVLLLDEPELGLSDGFARALGEYLGSQADRLPPTCSGMLVVTHSRPLVAGVLAAAGTDPTFGYLGTEDFTIHDWLAHEERFTVDELLELPALNLARFRAAGTKILGQGR